MQTFLGILKMSIHSQFIISQSNLWSPKIERLTELEFYGEWGRYNFATFEFWEDMSERVCSVFLGVVGDS